MLYDEIGPLIGSLQVKQKKCGWLVNATSKHSLGLLSGYRGSCAPPPFDPKKLPMTFATPLSGPSVQLPENQGGQDLSRMVLLAVYRFRGTNELA